MINFVIVISAAVLVIDYFKYEKSITSTSTVRLRLTDYEYE